MITLALTIVLLFCTFYFGMRAAARRLIRHVPSLELMGLSWMYQVIDVFLVVTGVAVVFASLVGEA